MKTNAKKKKARDIQRFIWQPGDLVIVKKKTKEGEDNAEGN